MDKIALITGGGRGLGRAFAVALAGAGWRVAVASRSPGELDETLELVRTTGAQAIAVLADVTDERAVESMITSTEAQLGALDLLVNNAGAGPPFGPLWETDPGEWWRNIEVNLKGPMLCCRAVLPGMIQRQRGRIINVASGAGTLSIPYMSAYVTGKAALIRLTEILADELHPHGVSVFAIQPATVRTAMAEQLLQSEAGRRWLPWFQKMFDNHMDVSTEPGSQLVLRLASGECDAASGHFFVVPEIYKPGLPAEDLGVLRMKK